MRNLSFIFLLCLVCNFSFSQDTIRKRNNTYLNSLQIDLGSNGLHFAVHYERVFLKHNRFSTSVNVGISRQKSIDLEHYLYFPIELNELYALKNHNIELGLGTIISNSAQLNPETLWTLNDRFIGRFGYRYQKPDGRVVIRLGYTPYLVLYSGSDILRVNYFNSFGLSFGYRF